MGCLTGTNARGEDEEDGREGDAGQDMLLMGEVGGR